MFTLKLPSTVITPINLSYLFFILHSFGFPLTQFCLQNYGSLVSYTTFYVCESGKVKYIVGVGLVLRPSCVPEKVGVNQNV